MLEAAAAGGRFLLGLGLALLVGAGLGGGCRSRLGRLGAAGGWGRSTGLLVVGSAGRSLLLLSISVAFLGLGGAHSCLGLVGAGGAGDAGGGGGAGALVGGGGIGTGDLSTPSLPLGACGSSSRSSSEGVYPPYTRNDACG